MAWFPAGDLHTNLEPDDETVFREWYANWAASMGMSPDPDDPAHQYDYRGAWLQMGKPVVADVSGDTHLPSKFKDWSHPRRMVEDQGRIIDTKLNLEVPVAVPRRDPDAGLWVQQAGQRDTTQHVRQRAFGLNVEVPLDNWEKFNWVARYEAVIHDHDDDGLYDFQATEFLAGDENYRDNGDEDFTGIFDQVHVKGAYERNGNTLVPHGTYVVLDLYQHGSEWVALFDWTDPLHVVVTAASYDSDDGAWSVTWVEATVDDAVASLTARSDEHQLVGNAVSMLPVFAGDTGYIVHMRNRAAGDKIIFHHLSMATDNLKSVGSTGEQEAAYATDPDHLWKRNDDAADSSYNGLELTMLTRMAYDDTGDEVLYGYYRTLKFDQTGRLFEVGVETRVTIDTPDAC